MDIHYTFETDRMTKSDLEKLFLALDWESGKFPDKLYEAMIRSHSVVTAWKGEQLVGLANALSDGALTVYFHYVLTDPAYQGRGIGRHMMELMLEKYKDYYTKVLISYPQAVRFYKRLGFQPENESMPMYRWN
ncbi:GNAT family N-acetyltransferase [Bacillus xiapuensis]|uniref:GNAT family N-acetyltransferase n=1 Tax=Bacillus xiapuensis TaxID=2014075 RepID=UPI000C239780|nr:GNAT family N-acetyltransferase [Bacillus xiapuensis]